ncbi:hypothetical protein EVG20_g8589 [Dentipellis fragilis]|uniref:Uncharacterized protein n=1 Tax=Dentipellis fragilis TaxID=205917 RepID=A0A4Y9Y4B5_9AGAM|nr:hypothetical protein EVG20_g8589 [Dentipellis fragilis]
MFRRVAVTTRMQVSAASRTLAVRQLHSSPIVAKSAAEKVKEVVHEVNLKVGKGLASAIETGQEVTEKTKGKLGTTKEKAGQTKEDVKAKTKETAEQAAQKKNELKSEVNDQLR